MYYAQEGKLSDNLLYGSSKSSENALKRRKRRESISKKREAKLAVDTSHRRSGRTHNLINRKTYQDSNSLRSFKIISKKPASFAFVSPKAANRAQKATSVDPLKTKHARYVLPRGIGSLNLGTTDHGSHSWSRSTRSQTTGPLKLRRKKGSGTDNNDGDDILPSDGTTSNNTESTPLNHETWSALQQYENTSKNTVDNSQTSQQRGNARPFSAGSTTRKKCMKPRRRLTRLSRKKDRIARRLGFVRRPRSAPNSRKKKKSVQDQDELMFDVCAPIRPGKKLNDYILLKNHANDMTACVGLMDDAIGSICGAERLVTYRNGIISKTLKNNADQMAKINHKLVERERVNEYNYKQAQIEENKSRNWSLWRLRSDSIY